MANTIIRPTSREEWLKVRANGIGSSEVGTILGLNPFETPYQLWRRKQGLDEPKTENFAMKAGHYLEDAVSQFWQDATGKQVIKASVGDWIIQRTDKPYMQVSPDRTYWLGESRGNSDKGILECKTTQKQIDADDLPKHWFCQIQYQLGVAELQQGSLAWLTAGRDFGYKDVAFVPDFYDYICEEVDHFYNVNIIEGVEPNPINVADIMAKYDKSTENKSVLATDELYDIYAQLKAYREDKKALETREKELEEQLKIALGDAEILSYNGSTLATWKSKKSSEKLDDKALKADNPELWAKYAKTVAGSRTFLLK